MHLCKSEIDLAWQLSAGFDPVEEWESKCDFCKILELLYVGVYFVDLVEFTLECWLLVLQS